MQITVTIPDETAARMLGDDAAPGRSLLELAGYTACVNGRISEYEFMKLLGLESRFDLHAAMKRMQSEAEGQDLEVMRQDMAVLAQMNDAPRAAKAR